MKTIFITGASSGLGKATAGLFAAKGWKVIATMRQPGVAQALTSGGNITVLPLDVTDPVQIEATVRKVTEEHEVDVVFNNAGYGLIGPLETVADQQLERQFETNTMGVIRVTRAFIPYFRQRGQGLFIATTSIAGLTGIPLAAIYCATKWAIEGWSEAMSFELNQLGIGIKTIAAGGIKTDFAGRSLDTTSHAAYEALSQKLYASFNPEEFTPAGKIAEVVYTAATDGKDQVRYIAGDDANASYAHRLEAGSEEFRRETRQFYLG